MLGKEIWAHGFTKDQKIGISLCRSLPNFRLGGSCNYPLFSCFVNDFTAFAYELPNRKDSYAGARSELFRTGSKRVLPDYFL
jgi:hypothetical protein